MREHLYLLVLCAFIGGFACGVFLLAMLASVEADRELP